MDLFVHVSVHNFQALQAGIAKHTAEGKDLTNLFDAQGNTLMHACVQQNSIQCLQVVTKHLPALVVKRNPKTHAEPLHVAIATGMLNVVHGLLSANADPNSLCPDNVVGKISPLATAVSKGNLPLVSILLNARAKVDTLTLVLAIRCRNPGLVSMLLQRSTDRSAINGQLSEKEAASLSLRKGSTPLIAAIQLKLHDMVVVLINVRCVSIIFHVNQRCQSQIWCIPQLTFRRLL